MMYDIYEKPNMVIFVDTEETEKVVEVLRSNYSVKEKGTHSEFTNDKVDYWELIRPGIISARLLSFKRLGRTTNGNALRTYNSLIKILTDNEIKYEIQGIHVKRK